MVQDEAAASASSSVISSPLQFFSSMSISPGSPYTPWVQELKSDERGLYLIHLLLNCANHVAAGSLDQANSCLEQISMLASPTGDTMQRIASHFTEALARRVLRSWPGLYRALNLTTTDIADSHAARRHFFDLCPFIKVACLICNQAIMEAMEGEKVVHIIDLHAIDPIQWVALLQALRQRPEGPPHLRITGISDHKELLDVTGARLCEEAEKLDIPFQFHPVLAKVENLDVESLRVKTGEAVAVCSLFQLHCLLASDDDIGTGFRKFYSSPSPAATHSNNKNTVQLHKIMQLTQGTLGELLEKDIMANAKNAYSPDSASSPFALAPSPKMERFLASVWSLTPKIMLVTEQESNHNGATMNERFVEALNFYAALFDCLESTVPRISPERMKVEKMMFGEEIKNIIACEGGERKERHEKLDKWVQRLDIAGFCRVPLSYLPLLQADRFLQSYGCDGYKLKEENGYIQICWQDRALFSVSAWRCRRFE
ncbi:Transcription factor GRAS domain-containing protein [Dioscorea alata]|uniref:Transcription factor GRAS domain-containing protein n=1 Tax=Dioscorea alata TaxID=55571 RepID=A0ACB7V1I2_DIOAL|nr:Transcription factor GRAS domain-containing protein [Dioscorea alata]